MQGVLSAPEGPGGRIWQLVCSPPSGEAQQMLGFTTPDLQEELQPQ